MFISMVYNFRFQSKISNDIFKVLKLSRKIWFKKVGMKIQILQVLERETSRILQLASLQLTKGWYLTSNCCLEYCCFQLSLYGSFRLVCCIFSELNSATIIAYQKWKVCNLQTQNNTSTKTSFDIRVTILGKLNFNLLGFRFQHKFIWKFNWFVSVWFEIKMHQIKMINVRPYLYISLFVSGHRLVLRGLALHLREELLSKLWRWRSSWKIWRSSVPLLES